MNIFFALLLLDFWAPLTGARENDLIRRGFQPSGDYWPSNPDSGVIVTGGFRRVMDARHEPVVEGYSAIAGALTLFCAIPKRAELATQLTKALHCSPVSKSKAWIVECDIGLAPWIVRVCGRVMILHDNSQDSVSGANAVCELVRGGAFP